MALIACPECRSQVSSSAAACPQCGHPLGTPHTAVKNRSTAALLAFFLGGLGIHKFYLGRPGMGVLYALFCWTFIPMVLGLLESIVYISHSDAAFQQKYAR